MGISDPEQRKALLLASSESGVELAKIVRNLLYLLKDVLSLANTSSKVVRNILGTIASQAPVVGLIVAALDLATNGCKLVNAVQSYNAIANFEKKLMDSALDYSDLHQFLTASRKRFDKIELQLTARMHCESSDYDSDVVNEAKQCLLVLQLKELNQKRIARKSFELLIDVAEAATNISLICGAGIVSAGIFATSKTVYVGAFAKRHIKQKIHNYRDDAKSAKAKHKEYCELISIMVEMLFQIKPPNTSSQTMQMFMRQVSDMNLLFKAAGYPMSSFLNENIPFQKRLQQLYNQLRER